MRTILLSIAALSVIAGGAAAQQGHTGHTQPGAMQPGAMPPGMMHGSMSPEMAAMHGGPQAGPEFMANMHRMMQAMMTQSMDPDPARAWALMMIPHHQGAIDDARVVLKYSKDPDVRRIATTTIEENEKGIAELQAWLDQHGGRTSKH